MKTTLISTLAALSFAILAIITFSGCASTRGVSGGGVHTMGGPKSEYPMSNQSMPGGR